MREVIINIENVGDEKDGKKAKRVKRQIKKDDGEKVVIVNQFANKIEYIDHVDTLYL